MEAAVWMGRRKHQTAVAAVVVDKDMSADTVEAAAEVC